MRKAAFLVFFFIMFQQIHAANELSSITTTLIIIEEKENNTFALESTPFSDGIFDAIWDKDYIFFDMKIDKPMLYAGTILSAQPYLSTARGSGADSILLVKLNYTTKKEGKQTWIHIPSIEYHLYSLNSMKTVKHGKIELNIRQIIQSADEKYKLLKSSGSQVLNEIYQQ